MTIRLGGLLLVIGGALLLVGVIFGATQVTATGVSCGSVFSGASTSANTQDFVDALNAGDGGLGTTHSEACTDALAGRKTPTWSLLAAGLFVGAVGGIVMARDRAAAQVAPAAA